MWTNLLYFFNILKMHITNWACFTHSRTKLSIATIYISIVPNFSLFKMSDSLQPNFADSKLYWIISTWPFLFCHGDEISRSCLIRASFLFTSSFLISATDFEIISSGMVFSFFLPSTCYVTRSWYWCPLCLKLAISYISESLFIFKCTDWIIFWLRSLL